MIVAGASPDSRPDTDRNVAVLNGMESPVVTAGSGHEAGAGRLPPKG